MAAQASQATGRDRIKQAVTLARVQGYAVSERNCS
jgi:hypothetical protein